MTSKVLFVLISVLCLAFVIGKSIHLQVQDGDFAIASNGTEQVQVLVSSTEKVPLATTHLTHPDFMLLEVLVNETVLEANLTDPISTVIIPRAFDPNQVDKKEKIVV